MRRRTVVTAGAVGVLVVAGVGLGTAAASPAPSARDRVDIRTRVDIVGAEQAARDAHAAEVAIGVADGRSAVAGPSSRRALLSGARQAERLAQLRPFATEAWARRQADAMLFVAREDAHGGVGARTAHIAASFIVERFGAVSSDGEVAHVELFGHERFMTPVQSAEDGTRIRYRLTLQRDATAVDGWRVSGEAGSPEPGHGP